MLSRSIGKKSTPVRASTVSIVSKYSTNTQADLDHVALRLNTRSRKTLGYETPADRLAAAVASTGRTRPASGPKISYCL